jgi:predicted secreted protein
VDYQDIRNKKIVFLNHCLLNVDARGPGVAFRRGPSTELIQSILKKDVNIIQLPCCECIGWGGAARKEFDKFLPVITHAVRFGWFPLLMPMLKASLSSYNSLCKKEAVKVVERMEDYLREGFTICGVIGMNDSPTCGVTKKVNMIEYMKQMAIAIHAGNDVDPVKMNLDQLTDGKSFFMGNLIEEIRKRSLDIKVIGFEPWAESLEAESARIVNLLNL